jgi:hypothetical protein
MPPEQLRMTFAEYLLLGDVNMSTLVEMQKSPLHFKHRLATPQKETPLMRKGRAGHTSVLEPERLLAEYALWEGKKRQGKAWDKWRADNPGKQDITPDEIKRCLRLRELVRAHPLAGSYLEHIEAELTLRWTDSETGVDCKGRIDGVNGAILDLKFSHDISAREFARTAYRFKYHMRGAWYRDGYAAVTGKVLPVVLIVVEQDPPHDIGVYQIPEPVLDQGQAEYLELLERVAFCRESGEWPGQFQSEQTLTLPAWAEGGDDDDLSALGLEAG